MKFEIGQRVHLWHENGEGMSDGTLLEVIAWRQTDEGYQYRCDNLSSDLPMWCPENVLVSNTEYQHIAQRLINGDLRDSYIARSIRNPYYNWFIYPQRGMYIIHKDNKSNGY